MKPVDSNSLLLAALWQRQQALRMTSVQYADDRIVELDFRLSTDAKTVEAHVSMQTTAEALLAQSTDIVDLNVGDGVKGPENTRIYVGETSWGEEGVVAVGEHDGQLRWLFFCEYSNPFDESTLTIGTENNFSVSSTYGSRWHFNVNSPQHVSVECGEFGWPRSPFWE